MDPFRERIENLLRQGKISPEEANKLLKALDNTGDTTSAPLTGSQPAPTIPSAPPPPPRPAAPPEPVTPPPQPARAAPPPPPAPPVAVTQSSATIDGLTAKLVVSTNAGDINIKGVPGKPNITAHSNNGTIEVIHDGGTVRLVAHGRIEDPTEIGWLNTVLRTIGRNLPVNLDVEVPAELALLEVKAIAGDVEVIGVNGRVKMDLQAGDLKLDGASSFEINTKAGDVKVNTKLLDGESKLVALAGDVDVHLQPGSSVTLTATTTAGDVSARGFILTQTEKRMVGGSLEGRLGAGRAKLECRLTAGDLDIVAMDGTNQ
jgi:Putative adhesin